VLWAKGEEPREELGGCQRRAVCSAEAKFLKFQCLIHVLYKSHYMEYFSEFVPARQSWIRFKRDDIHTNTLLTLGITTLAPRPSDN
jgi:hypothetical protein